MVDPEVDSQPLFENEDRFQPFPDSQSQDYADSDPVRVSQALCSLSILCTNFMYQWYVFTEIIVLAWKTQK